MYVKRMDVEASVCSLEAGGWIWDYNSQIICMES